MSRRAPGTNSAGSPGSTRSTSRTSSSTLPAYSPTRPSTRTVSPTSKRCSSTRHAVPHARAHAPALVGELEIEEWASVSPRAPLLARHREGRVHERARRELAHERATGHCGEYTAAARAVRPPRPRRHPGYPPRVSGPVPERVEIRPFHALHYAADRVRLADVVSPPYDVIDEDLRAPPARAQPVQRRAPDPPGAGRGARGRATRSRPGAARSVVVREPRPCMYWLEQHARGPDGVRRRRAGLIAALRLEPYAPGRVRRHERTLDGAQGRPPGRAARRARQPLADLHGLRRPVAAHQRDLRADRRRARADLRDDRRGGHLAPALARLRGRAAARRDRGRRQPAAHDHRRPPPLRDGARLPRRAARGRRRSARAAGLRLRARLPREPPRPRARAVPDAPRRQRPRAPSCGSACPSCWPSAGSSRRSPTSTALERRIVAPPRGVRTFGLVRGDGAPPLHARLRGEAPAPRSTSSPSARSCCATCSASTPRPSRRPIASPTASAPTTPAALVAAAPPRTAVALLVPAPTVADVEAVADAERDDAARSRRSSSRRSSTAWSSTSSTRSTRDRRALARGLPRDARRRRRGGGGRAARAPGRRARARRRRRSRRSPSTRPPRTPRFAVLERPRRAAARASRSSPRRSASAASAAAAAGASSSTRSTAASTRSAACRCTRSRSRSPTGPTMADVALGYVYDLGNGEEWIARRGGGATVDGVPLGSVAAARAAAARRARGDAARAPRAGRRRAPGRGRARARARLARARALPPRRRPRRRRREPAAERRALDRHRGRAAAGARGRRGGRPAGRRRARSAPRRSTSSGARASSRRATTRCVARVAALLGIGPAAGSAPIRASMPS